MTGSVPVPSAIKKWLAAGQLAKKTEDPLPENREIWRHFKNLFTQFKYTENGYVIGLDYSCVESYLNMTIDDKSTINYLFEGIKICEEAYINKANELIARKRAASKHG